MPSNIESGFVYDAKANRYLWLSFYNNRRLSTALALSPKEFFTYTFRRQEQETYRQLNKSSLLISSTSQPSIFDKASYHQRPKLLENLFGVGGFKFHINASAELSAGLNRSYTDNPRLSERAKSNSFFDFKEQINADLSASLGTKLKFKLNYNTNATFSSDAKQLKLSYIGDTDDIIKNIDFGQVSMQSSNSLIGGVKNLFGFYSRWQFGRLNIDMLLGQQKTHKHQIRTQGGNTEQTYELLASDYMENQHFFLSGFFRNQYNKALSTRPYVNSAVRIHRIEVWISNRQSRYDEARHIVAFADLGESKDLHNQHIHSTGSEPQADNRANSLYQELTSTASYRNIQSATNHLSPRFRISWDYDKEESARRLSPNEYTLNETLGYISLHTPLRADEVLAVAFEYSYQGKVYQVGEFSGERVKEDNQALFVKLLKGRDTQPQAPYWLYMMRNVYALASAGTQLSQDDITLDLYYRNHESGRALNYMPTGAKGNERLINLFAWDIMNKQGEAKADTYFDFVEGLTINRSRGWLFLPQIEPFGKDLEAIGVEKKYIYSELYTLPRTDARRQAEKNRYLLRGTYRGRNTGIIQISSGIISPGAVSVSAAGQELQEGNDYSIDYEAGTLTILNQQILHSHIPLDINVDEERNSQEQRQTWLGLNINYKLRQNMHIGASAMYMSELPLESKATLGQASMRNLIWGAHFKWNDESPWLQRLLKTLPLQGLEKPSLINLELEYAQLRPGYRSSDGAQAGYSYLDDFDNSQSEIDLLSAYAWSLSSTPATLLNGANSSNEESNSGRAHLSWFTIDPLFIRERSKLIPNYIKSDPNKVSSHYIREIELKELYPNREYPSGLVGYLPTLNLRFYPNERGMYNLSSKRLNSEGYLRDPEHSWGGIMRKLDVSDFEASNIEYLEFWLMDPNLENVQKHKGDLYINFGDISEDILLDGKKSYENGLPTKDTDNKLVDYTLWGRIPKRNSIGYSFDNNAETRNKQDLGLDGLSTQNEAQHETYLRYRQALQSVLSPQTLSKWQKEEHSPLRDLAGDDFKHYLSKDYDDEELDILERYKYYNGLEGNSREQASNLSHNSASKTLPDTEDINQDNNLNELNRYYEYKVSLNPNELRVGHNYVVASRTLDIKLRNGETSPVTWYQFRIPLRDYHLAVGGMSDMRSMRFMRMYLSGFTSPLNLRFGALRLIRGSWRVYPESLSNELANQLETGQLSLSAVNIEEHNDRSPINYVLPPSVTRSIDISSTQHLQTNEQALSLKVEALAPNESKAIYRHVQYDLRNNKKLELFVHAENQSEQGGNLQNGDLELFLRLGTDFKSDYYECALPLNVTPTGQYSSNNVYDQLSVWPQANKIELDLSELTSLKRDRNNHLASGKSIHDTFSKLAQSNSKHRLSVLGNPSLGSIRSIMIGVRNRSQSTQYAEIWLNELRVGEPQENTAHALRGHFGLELSDLASINLSGGYSTTGFGVIDQTRQERQREDKQSLNAYGNIQFGKLLPQKAQVNFPLYFSYQTNQSKPEYSPFDDDIPLNSALKNTSDKERKKLEDYSISRHRMSSINITGAKVGIRSKQPMPYDPANFTLSFNHTKNLDQTPELAYSTRLNWDVTLQYDYTPTFKGLRPFSKLKGENSLTRYLKTYSLQLWPSLVSFKTSLLRNYEEEQLRNPIEEDETAQRPAHWAHQFIWNRRLNLNWHLTPNLKLHLKTGTDARIEMPNVQVNRQLNPDDYALWREAVDKSIAELGLPQRYTQESHINYTLPTQSIKALTWLHSTISYTANYQWELGATIPQQSLVLPNTISNQSDLNLNSQLRMRMLYKLFPRLERVEKLFARRSKNNEKNNKLQAVNNASWQDYLLYGLTMIKDIQLSIRKNRSTHLAGYLPHIGAALGQGYSGNELAPGIAFALGLHDEHISDKFMAKGYLSKDPNLSLSALYTESRIVDFKANLRPIRDLNITLIANHSQTQRSEHQYNYPERPRHYGGDMQMTAIGLRGFFKSSKSETNYQSEVFEHFLRERHRLHGELNHEIRQRGSLADLDLNSSAVLIPAFRSTYLGQKTSQGLLPKIWAMRPNWSVTYNGLTRIAGLSRWFSQIAIKHDYRGIYRINSYESYTNWQGIEGTNLGELELSGKQGSKRISLGEDVASISLSENFLPLIGLELTFRNGLSLSNQWRRSRSLTLALGAARLIETMSNEWDISTSYRIANLRSLWSPSANRNSKSRNKAKKKESNHALTLKLNYNYRRSHSLIRQISEAYTQATSGNLYHRLNLSLDYELSKYITLRAYYEHSQNTPLVSSSAYPTSLNNYGVSLKLNISH